MSQPPPSSTFQPRIPAVATTTAPTTTTVPAATPNPTTPQYYSQHPLIRPPVQYTTTPGPPLPPRPPLNTTASSSTSRSAVTPTYTAASTTRPTAPTASFVSNVAAAKQVKKVPALKGTFSKDRKFSVRPMMHAFGDHPNPAPDTVSVMEEILMDYMVDVCTSAMKKTRKNQVQIDGLREALSHPADAKKLARMEELLFMQEDIKRARAQFNEKDDRGAP